MCRILEMTCNTRDNLNRFVCRNATPIDGAGFVLEGKMAERRMFAKRIIDSDAFLDMPLSTQSLYFHLSMRADDEGFINNPKRIQRMIGASDDDCKLLIAKGFILVFETGVIVIKHWKIHNYIQKDRFKPTICLEEKREIVTEEGGTYTQCTRNGYALDTQVRIGKVSIGKVNNIEQPKGVEKIPPDIEIEKEKDIEKESKPLKRFTAPTLEDVKAYCEERKNNVDAERFINYYTANGWKVGKNPMKDWKAAVRSWERNDFGKPKTAETEHSFDLDDFFNAAVDKARRQI